MSIVRKLTVGALLAALAPACAVRFQQPDEAAVHAVLALPSQETQRDRRIFVEPLEFNGLSRPRNWLLADFRIPTGEFRLLAKAANEHHQGSCLLQFIAVAGQTYDADAGLDGETFMLQVLEGDEVVASCTVAAEALPTPARTPGVPSR